MKKEKEINLTPTEALYFDALLKEPTGLARHVLRELRPPEPERISNVVDVHIKNLRQKLDHKYKIVLLRGRGYKLIKK